MEFDGYRKELILFQTHLLEDEEWIFRKVMELYRWNIMAAAGWNKCCDKHFGCFELNVLEFTGIIIINIR